MVDHLWHAIPAPDVSVCFDGHRLLSELDRDSTVLPVALNGREQLAAGLDRIEERVRIKHLQPLAMDRGVPSRIESNQTGGGRHVRNAGLTEGEHGGADPSRLFGLARLSAKAGRCQLERVDDVKDAGHDAVEVVVELPFGRVMSRRGRGRTVETSGSPGKETLRRGELSLGRGGHHTVPMMRTPASADST
jgi:hypothetical protein